MIHENKTKTKIAFPEPSLEQKEALRVLNSNKNVFLTGSAGTGKSFVIREHLRKCILRPSVLASTGAAAVLIGGRTVHSFFGLGILENGINKTVEKALKDRRVVQRLKKADEIIIDEISMIHPDVFTAAEKVARFSREEECPFGGLKIITVGDFFQLPSVDRFNKNRPWLFKDPLWKSCQFSTVTLQKSHRTEHLEFLKILNKVRFGICDKDVTTFLDDRCVQLDNTFDGTVLFPRKNEVERYNQQMLERLPGKAQIYDTEIHFTRKTSLNVHTALNYSPLPASLCLKKGALVMIRKNHPNEWYVNGSLGHVKKMNDSCICVELLSGRTVEIEKDQFNILNGDGEPICVVMNFPLNLGWATTIHKAQGASIDRVQVSLNGLWDPGQAYVALSRARSPEGLFITNWNHQSIICDVDVLNYFGMSSTNNLTR